MLDPAKKSAIPPSMILERNNPAPMRDGVRLFANLAFQHPGGSRIDAAARTMATHLLLSVA
jgi:hypothetical protein